MEPKAFVRLACYYNEANKYQWLKPLAQRARELFSAACLVDHYEGAFLLCTIFISWRRWRMR